MSCSCPHPSKYFQVVHSGTRNVLTAHTEPDGAKGRVTYAAKNPENSDEQIWYENEAGVLISKLNDFAICARNHNEVLTMEPYDTCDNDHQWVFDKCHPLKITKNKNDCVTYDEDDKLMKQSIWKDHSNQHWHKEYISSE